MDVIISEEKEGEVGKEKRKILGGGRSRFIR